MPQDGLFSTLKHIAEHDMPEKTPLKMKKSTKKIETPWRYAGPFQRVIQHYKVHSIHEKPTRLTLFLCFICFQDMDIKHMAEHDFPEKRAEVKKKAYPEGRTPWYSVGDIKKVYWAHVNFMALCVSYREILRVKTSIYTLNICPRTRVMTKRKVARKSEVVLEVGLCLGSIILRLGDRQVRLLYDLHNHPYHNQHHHHHHHHQNTCHSCSPVHCRIITSFGLI